MGQGDELVQVPQARLVFGQDNEVLGHPLGLAQGAGPGQGGVYLLEGVHPPVPEHLDEGHQHISHHGRVVRGPVVVEVRQVQVAADDVQLVLAQLRQQVLGQGEGIQKGGGKGNAVPLTPGPDKADVKLRVVGGQRAAVHKGQKGPQGLLLAGGPHQHVVGDAGELDDVGGQLPLGVHKGLEPLLHLPLLQDHRADLGDHILGPAQARGLQVKADDGPVQVLVLGAPDGEAVVYVVDIVSLGAQQDLQLVLAGAPGIGEGLGHTMVGDGDGGMTPGNGPLHRVLGVGEGVHQGHLGVQVELHPFFRGVVLLHGLLRRLNDQGLQDHVVVKPVQVQPAGDLQVHPRLDPLHNGESLVPGHELAHPDGAGVVGDVKADDPGTALFQLPVLHGEDVSLHGDHPHVQLQGIHGLGGLFDLAGAVDPLGGKALGLLVGRPGLRHGLLAQGLRLAEQPLLLGEGLLRRGLLRRRGGRDSRRGFRRGGRVRRGCLGAGRVEGHSGQAIDLGQFPFHLPENGGVRELGAEELGLNGPVLAVQHRAGDQPACQDSGQGGGGAVLKKHLKKGQIFLWHR